MANGKIIDWWAKMGELLRQLWRTVLWAQQPHLVDRKCPSSSAGRLRGSVPRQSRRAGSAIYGSRQPL